MMLQNQISNALKQFDEIARLSVRGTASSAAAVLLLCAIFWYVGHPILAWVIAVSHFAVRFAVRQMFKQYPPFEDMGRRQVLVTALLLQVGSMIVSMSPAIMLAAHPSVALKVLALFCLVGAQIFVTNTWARVQFFMCAFLGPLILMLGLTFFALTQSVPQASPLIHWGFAAVYLIIFVYMSIETLRQQVTADKDLRGAREQAATRLAQLEESHRLDSLTGLLNRPAFDSALHTMLADRTADTDQIAVIMIDLDSFKPINDTYSHEAGDCVLVTTAKRLRSLVGDSGIVGRLGGDEFICALFLDPDQLDPVLFGKRAQTSINQPIKWQSRALTVAASIGIALTGDDEEAPEAAVPALCAAADQAMFAAKSSPSNYPVLFRASSFRPRMSAEDKQLLVDSIKDSRVRPFYQPKIHLPSGNIIGFEALARWDHPTLGLQHPDVFIAQINELGLQGDFMMSNARHVVADIEWMLSYGLDPGQVSLNVSEVALATLSGREELHALIADHPEAAKHMTLEITEDVFIARSSETIQASIAAFRAQGMRISLDDFGTGFASFHHLRQLELDELKIDTSFVAGLGFDPSAEVLVRGFLDIASGLGVNVIAEGVETEAQSRDLINMGCMTAQGFLFSPAVSLEDALNLLRNQQVA